MIASDGLWRVLLEKLNQHSEMIYQLLAPYQDFPENFVICEICTKEPCASSKADSLCPMKSEEERRFLSPDVAVQVFRECSLLRADKENSVRNKREPSKATKKLMAEGYRDNAQEDLKLTKECSIAKEQALRKRTGKQWAMYFYQHLGYRIVEDEETENALKNAMDKVFDGVFAELKEKQES